MATAPVPVRTDGRESSILMDWIQFCSRVLALVSPRARRLLGADGIAVGGGAAAAHATGVLPLSDTPMPSTSAPATLARSVPVAAGR